ncbi:MAG: hypothetical protein OEX19_17765 [Gammaproteobacteria bacterium]|nr:hypothetical protein [Gammaproteobacteria bacterium]
MLSRWLSKLFLISAISFSSAQADVAWEMDFKAGAFLPNLDSWSDYYGTSYAYSGASNVSVRVLKFFVLGADLIYTRASGVGEYASNGQTGGEVSYELLPGNAYAGLQAQFAEGQWVVPYAGVSYGRSFYRQKIAFQSDVRGATNGYTLKAGMKLLLDKMDHSSAKLLKEGFGVQHSYWIVEYQKLVLTAGDVDIGGHYLFSGLALSF